MTISLNGIPLGDQQAHRRFLERQFDCRFVNSLCFSPLKAHIALSRRRSLRGLQGTCSECFHGLIPGLS